MLHFQVSVYCLMLLPLHFMCAQYVGVLSQRIDPSERVMFLLHEGHVYFVCSPGLLSMSPASVSIVRRAHRASRPSSHAAAVRGRLVKKTAGVRPSLGGRAEVAGKKVSARPRFGRLRSPADAALPPLASRCIGSYVEGYSPWLTWLDARGGTPPGSLGRNQALTGADGLRGVGYTRENSGL